MSLAIIRNAARCKKCGDVLESKHRHDLVTCKCGNFAVSGGADHLRRVGNPNEWDEMGEFADFNDDSKRQQPRPAREKDER